MFGKVVLAVIVFAVLFILGLLLRGFKNQFPDGIKRDSQTISRPPELVDPPERPADSWGVPVSTAGGYFPITGLRSDEMSDEPIGSGYGVESSDD